MRLPQSRCFKILLVPCFLLLGACTVAPIEAPDDENFYGHGHAPAPRVKRPAPRNVGALQAELGMKREAADLGFAEKSFDPCQLGMSNECGSQYLTVIHFQLLCRDSEGTVSAIPKSLMPIVSPRIRWSVGGQSGSTLTDRNGYGHLAVVSARPLGRHRLILRKGPHYVGVSAGEVSKLVLPKNWCG